MTQRHLVLIFFVAACNGAIINTPVRSFDRPEDAALTCVQLSRLNYFDSGVWSPLPLSECSPDRKDARKYLDPVDLSQQTFIVPQLRGFVTQSSRGEVAEIDAEVGTLLDYNRGVPGFTFLPTGKGTEHIRASSDGCHAFVTNPGSCDLASLDLQTIYNAPFLPFRDGGIVGFPDGLPPGYGNDVVLRLAPSVNGRKLGARPAWIEMAPDSQSALHVGDPTGNRFIEAIPGDGGVPAGSTALLTDGGVA